MPGPLYFVRAVRLSAYEGVLRHRVQALHDGGTPPPTTTAAAASRREPEVPEGVWLAQHSDWIDYD